MKIQTALLLCLLHGVLGNGSVDMTKTNQLENHQTNYASISRNGQAAYLQNRDSYVNAANQAGYSVGGSTNNNNNVGPTGGNPVAAASSSYGVPASAAGGYASGQAASGSNPAGSMTYYYYHYPAGQAAQASQAVATGWGGDTTGYDDDDSFGGGLGGLAGLLGLKGLKGLGGLGLLALLKLFKPLLLPLFLPLLLLLLLPLLLFLPIPVITIPSQGRSMETSSVGEYISERFYGGVQTVQKVLGSEKCVERISCEIGRRGKGSSVDNIIQGVYNKMESYLSKPLRRGMRAYMDADSKSNKCAKYTCTAYSDFTSASTSNPADDKKINAQNTP